MLKTISLFILFLLSLFIFEIYSYPEKYNQDYNFQEKLVEQDKINAEILFLKKYDDFFSTYYVYTSAGKIKFDVNSKQNDLLTSNEILYEDLKNKFNSLEPSTKLFCSFELKKERSSWFVTNYQDCNTFKLTKLNDLRYE